MIPHGKAFKPGTSLGLPQGDQGKVGGSPAHIADQNKIIGIDVILPAVFMGDEPAVKCCQGLFKKGYTLSKAGLTGGLDGELPGSLIKGCRHSDHHKLIFKKSVLILYRIIPGLFDMAQIFCSGGDRRDLFNPLGTPGQNLCPAVSPGVAEPAFG